MLKKEICAKIIKIGYRIISHIERDGEAFIVVKVRIVAHTPVSEQ